MPPGNKTRKVRKCPLVKQANLSGRLGTHYTINYYDTKSVTKDGKYIQPIFDNCKKIYEVIEDDIWASNKRLVVRKPGSHKIVLDVPQPGWMSGNAFYESDTERTVAKSLLFHESEGDITYVGHQVFSFKLLEKTPAYKMEYFVYLTPSGIMKPYIYGKRYVYSLRDKVAVPKASLRLDMKRYLKEQLKELDAQFKTAAKQIPFPIEMIDAGME